MNIKEIDKRFEEYYLSKECLTPISDYVMTKTDGGWGEDLSVEEINHYIDFFTKELKECLTFQINEETEENWNWLNAYRSLLS